MRLTHYSSVVRVLKVETCIVSFWPLVGSVNTVNTMFTYCHLVINNLANSCLFTHPPDANFYSVVVVSVHQLLRKISGSLTAKCSTMFTS